MTDPNTAGTPAEHNDKNVEDAVVVDETNADATPLVEPETDSATYDDSTVEAHPEPVTEPEPVVEPEIVAEAEPTDSSASGAATSAEPRVVYVTAPVPPKLGGNRGFGVFIAFVSTVIFAILFAIVVVIVNIALSTDGGLGFIQKPSFFVPVAFFALASLIVALLVNRAGWAAHVLGSILVALLVYFGTIGVLLLANGVIQSTPEEAQYLFALALVDPRVIAASLVAREVSLWTGALVAKRGRKVTERNRATRAAWEAELAEKTAARRG